MKKIDRMIRPVGFLLALGALLFCSLSIYSASYIYCAAIDYDYVELGEALLHGFAPRGGDLAGRMPGFSALAALLSGHGNWISESSWIRVALAAQTLTLIGAGLLAGSAVGAFIAAAAFLAGPLDSVCDFPQSFQTFFTLLLAGMIMWRARNPTPAKSLLAGICLGSCLLYRSTLIFFPPILAAMDFFILPRMPKRQWLKMTAPILFLPYLFLLPYAAFTSTLHGRALLVEHRTAVRILLSGAMGFVHTLQRDPDLSVLNPRVPPESQAGEAILWAAREMAGSPARFFSIFMQRVRLAIEPAPLLLAASLFAFWVFRRRKDFWALGALCLYLLFMHSLLSGQCNYFTPLRALEFLAAGALWAKIERPFTHKFQHAGAVVLLSLLSAAVALSTWACAAALRYPRAATKDIAQNTLEHEPWLLNRFGQQLLRQGYPRQAAQHMAEALRLDPRNVMFQMDLETTLAMQNLDSAFRLGNREAAAYTFDYSSCLSPACGDLHLYFSPAKDPAMKRLLSSAGLAAASGKDFQAQHYLRLSQEWMRQRYISIGRMPQEASIQLQSRQAIQLFHEAQSHLWFWPPQFQTKLAKALVRFDKSLKPAADQWGSDSFMDQQQAMELYSRLGKPIRALELARKLTAVRPQEAELWLRRADLAASCGRKNESMTALKRVLSMSIEPSHRHRAALTLQTLGRHSEALPIFRLLASEETALRALYLKDKGISEFLNGNIDNALADLERAAALDPKSPEILSSLEVVYQRKGMRGKAAKILNHE